MALIHCPECSREVSEAAAACPACGHPISAGGAAVSVLHTPKSRGVYIVLGLLFGLLGVHNFYANRRVQGAMQLLITLALGWLIVGLVVSGLWALIDVIGVELDGDGEPMR